jgi:hypothetical protein
LKEYSGVFSTQDILENDFEENGFPTGFTSLIKQLTKFELYERKSAGFVNKVFLMHKSDIVGTFEEVLSEKGCGVSYRFQFGKKWKSNILFPELAKTDDSYYYSSSINEEIMAFATFKYTNLMSAQELNKFRKDNNTKIDKLGSDSFKVFCKRVDNNMRFALDNVKDSNVDFYLDESPYWAYLDTEQQKKAVKKHLKSIDTTTNKEFFLIKEISDSGISRLYSKVFSKLNNRIKLVCAYKEICFDKLMFIDKFPEELKKLNMSLREEAVAIIKEDLPIFSLTKNCIIYLLEKICFRAVNAKKELDMANYLACLLIISTLAERIVMFEDYVLQIMDCASTAEPYENIRNRVLLEIVTSDALFLKEVVSKRILDIIYKNDEKKVA